MEEKAAAIKGAITTTIFITIKVVVIIAVAVCVGVVLLAPFVADAEDENQGETGYNNATSSSWEQFIRYLHQLEGGGGITKNSKGEECYTVKSDGGGGSAVGYGVDIATHGKTLEKAGYSTSIGSLIPVSVVDSIEKEEREQRYSDVEAIATTNAIELTQYQIFALTSRTYNYGLVGGMKQATSSFIYPSNLTFVEAYKKHYKNINNDNYYGDYTKTDFNNGLYTEYMTWLNYKTGTHPSGWEERRKSEWSLFQTGYYGWGLKHSFSYAKRF